MNKIIISAYSGDLYKKMSNLTSPLIQNYAKKYNADYKLIKLKNIDRPASWQKIPIIKKYLKKYDIVLWIDVDVVIIYDEEDIFENIEPNIIQYMVNHQIRDFTVPNSGVWMVTKKILPYLDIIWENHQYINHGLWEQAALIELMGYEVDYFRSDLRYRTNLFHKTKWLHPKWNHHPEDLNQVEYPNFIHVTMYEDRLNKIKEIIKDFII